MDYFNLMQVNRRLQLAGFFLSLAEWDRHIEVIRQVLNSLDNFEPYAAFLRLSKGRSNMVTPSDIAHFLEENGVKSDEKLLALIVRLYDTNFEGFLNFEDFLKMVLARDNPDIRFQSALRPNYDVMGYENVLSQEIEYTLARFFKKATEFLQKMISDPETQFLIRDSAIFQEVDSKRSRRIDFNNLKAFFEASKIVPRDSEIISVLRVIDINDDGVITEMEFNYFIDLFSHTSPSDSVVMKLKGLKKQEMAKNIQIEPPVREISHREDHTIRRVPQFTSYTPNRTEISKTPSRADGDVSHYRTQPINVGRSKESTYQSIRHEQTSSVTAARGDKKDQILQEVHTVVDKPASRTREEDRVDRRSEIRAAFHQKVSDVDDRELESSSNARRNTQNHRGGER